MKEKYTFKTNKKLRTFVASRPFLHEILKEVHKVKTNDIDEKYRST